MPAIIPPRAPTAGVPPPTAAAAAAELLLLKQTKCCWHEREWEMCMTAGACYRPPSPSSPPTRVLCRKRHDTGHEQQASTWWSRLLDDRLSIIDDDQISTLQPSRSTGPPFGHRVILLLFLRSCYLLLAAVCGVLLCPASIIETPGLSLHPLCLSRPWSRVAAGCFSVRLQALLLVAKY